MFGEVEREFSFTRWVIQMALAYLLPEALLALCESSARHSDNMAWQASDYVAVALIAIIAASLVSRLAPDSGREGALIWVLPIALEACLAVAALLAGRPSEIGSLFLIPRGPDGGEGGWSVVLVTLPTWGCCWYSVAMWLRRRRPRPSGEMSSAL